MQASSNGFFRLQHYIYVGFRAPTQDRAFKATLHFSGFPYMVSVHHHPLTSLCGCSKAVHTMLSVDFYKSAEHSDFLNGAGMDIGGFATIYHKGSPLILVGYQIALIAFQILLKLTVRCVDQFSFAFCEHNELPSAASQFW